MRDSLSQGRALSSALLALPLREGTVTTWLPKGINVHVREAFQMGGILPGNLHHQAEHKLGLYISSFLGRTENHCAVFEHALARASDPFLAGETSQYFICGGDVYFFLTARDLDVEVILKAIQSAKTYLFNGVLADLSEISAISNREHVTEQTLRKLAENTKHLIVGAYDGEGYLMWDRPREM
jgi:hypothetical protein